RRPRCHPGAGRADRAGGTGRGGEASSGQPSDASGQLRALTRPSRPTRSVSTRSVSVAGPLPAEGFAGFRIDADFHRVPRGSEVELVGEPTVVVLVFPPAQRLVHFVRREIEGLGELHRVTEGDLLLLIIGGVGFGIYDVPAHRIDLHPVLVVPSRIFTSYTQAESESE